MIKKTKEYIKKNGGISSSIREFDVAVRQHGLDNVVKRIFGIKMGIEDNYQSWIKNHEKKYDIIEVNQRLESFKLNPKISFLIPVYNVGEVYLRACIDSIRNQYYQNWELCLSDDKSTAEHIQRVLEEYVALDARIKVIFREKNGHISEATNSALELATGEYIALVDNDDIIRPEALLEVVDLINRHPLADMIYTDEDKIDENGKERMDPFFKPDWSPDAFLCHMYICHLGVYRREIAKKIGGFRTEFNGSQDYDFALRFSEQTEYIYHVPQVLYHWRMLPTSTAAASSNKNYAFDAGVRAKKDAAIRRGYQVNIEVIESYGTTNFEFTTNKEDFISAIVLFKESAEHLKRTMDNLISQAAGDKLEILVIVKEQQEENEIFKVKEYQNYIRKVRFDEELCEAANLNNAVEMTIGNILVFIQSGISIEKENGLKLMSGHAKLGETGAVSCRIVGKNGIVQEAGVFSLNKEIIPSFEKYRKTDLGYFGRLQLNYNYLAVTKTLLIVEKTKFNIVGGFDASGFGQEYYDIDFCLKLYNNTYFNVVRGDVECVNEGKYQKKQKHTEELQLLNHKWGQKYLNEDPFYNINFSTQKMNFTIKK